MKGGSNMALFAIGDLHLGFGVNKTMDKFGEEWKNHIQKIEKNWRECIQQQDTVLLLGDISWGMTIEQTKPDFDFIETLPGKKICICGNHDYWWSNISKIQKMYHNIIFLRNNSVKYHNVFICGTRGWICPNDSFFTPQYEKIYHREVIRLKLSLEDAMKKGAEQIIVLLHFPPTNDKKEWSGFLELFQCYPVSHVYYAHLHGQEHFHNSLIGEYKGVFYDLVSCDNVDFCPKKIFV